MNRWLPCAFALLASLVPMTPASAQQSAGRYGQGQANPASKSRGANDRAEPVAPISPVELPFWKTTQAILTPGTPLSYPVEMKAGSLVFVTARSEDFDTAVIVFDAKGKELARSEDRAPGVQEPFLRFLAPADGTYQIQDGKGAGGRYELSYLQTHPYALGLGPNKIVVQPSPTNKFNVPYFKIALEKGKAYQFRRFNVEGRGEIEATLIGPTGIAFLDYEVVRPYGESLVVIPKASGDYYLLVAVSDRTEVVIKTEVQPVQIASQPDVADLNVTLAPKEARIFTFPQSERAFRRIAVGGSLQFEVKAISSKQRNYLPGEQMDPDPELKRFPIVEGDVRDQNYLFIDEAVARVLVINPDSRNPQSAAVRCVADTPNWTLGNSETVSLKVGENRYFIVEAKDAELMKVFVKASTFLPVMKIFNLEGELENQLSDRSTLTATDDLYFPKAGRFLFAVSCLGSGGSGSFEMKRDVPSAQALTLSQVASLELTGNNFGLYELDLTAGQRYEVRCETGASTSIDLLDAAGTFLQSQKLQFEGVRVEYFVAERTGKHRLWIRGAPGGRKLQLALHALPRVGGNG